MEDAYVIGIRLALDNGVSAGVAIIRDDLAKLDRAIAVSTANLRQLQTVATATTTSASLPLQPARQTQPAVIPTAGMMPPEAPTPKADRPSIAPPVLRPSSQPPAAAASQPNATTMRPEAPVVVITPPQAPSAPPPAAGSIQSRPETPVVAGLKPQSRPLTQSAPTREPLMPLPSFHASPASPASGHAPAVPSKAEQPALAAPSTAQTISFVPPVPPSAPKPAKPDLPLRPAAPSSPEASPLATPGLRLPAAPTRPITAPQTSVLAVAPSALPSAAPQSPQAQTAPTSGDVFLDGSRLGHWLASTLARQSSRPQAGTTGFDPRISATWPGAQQGGG